MDRRPVDIGPRQHVLEFAGLDMRGSHAIEGLGDAHPGDGQIDEGAPVTGDDAGGRRRLEHVRAVSHKPGTGLPRARTEDDGFVPS